MKAVLLIVAPFATIESPALGVSLLKSGLNREQISCDISYCNLEFANMIGLDMYEAICASGGLLLLGERVFAKALFKERLPDDEAFLRFLRRYYPVAGEWFCDSSYFDTAVERFVTAWTGSRRWQEYRIIGFSSMFEQNAASLLLARHIKQSDPSKLIVFGGANCEGDMGVGLLRHFPFIDYVCSGEADHSFPELVKQILSNRDFDEIPGIMRRKERRFLKKTTHVQIENLDELPYPDFDDYFNQLDPISACKKLNIETSRGCWWGEKSQCKFCGLNGESIEFRSKSQDRIIKEILFLIDNYAEKFSVSRLAVVDNILDMAYFDQLIPELCTRSLPVRLSFEVKSNLTGEHIRQLAQAGVDHIGPGIESLNSHVLRLMGKGVSALKNIQLLKSCEQFGVTPSWNILTGFPGEDHEDYRQLLDKMAKVIHLPPPDAATHFTLERFSPYFVTPKKYGLFNIRPAESYRFVYPFDPAGLFDLAYYFKFDYEDTVKPPNYRTELVRLLEYWRSSYANSEYLKAVDISPSALLIEDGRSNAVVRRIILEWSHKDIYKFCDDVHSLQEIFAHVRKKNPDEPIRSRDVKDFLANMVDLNLMVSEGDRYLSLAIPNRSTPFLSRPRWAA